jgi:hypothetical protein
VSEDIAENDQCVAPYPFYHEVFHYFDEDGPGSKIAWRPGTRFVQTAIDDGDYVWDGEGEIRLRVVGIYRPGKYPTRVFFVRQWVDPSGRVFGKTNLRMTTLGAFKRLAKGYRYPGSRDGAEYRPATVEETAEHVASLRAKILKIAA